MNKSQRGLPVKYTANSSTEITIYLKSMQLDCVIIWLLFLTISVHMYGRKVNKYSPYKLYSSWLSEFES